MICTAAASLSSRRTRSCEAVLALGPQPLQQPGQPERLAPRGLVQRLGDVPQVGQQPLAADRAEHAGGQPALLGRLEQRGDPAAAQQQRPAAQPVGELVGELLAAGVELAQGAAEERRERGRPHPPGPVRLLERLEQAQPLVTGRRRQQLRAAADHGRDAALGERRADQLGLRPLADEDRDVAGRDRLAVPRRVGGEQGGDVGGAVGGDVPAGVVGPDQSTRQREAAPRDLPQPERRRVTAPRPAASRGERR